MSNTVIKVENLSKQYRLGQIGTGSLAHDINRWWHKVRGNEDPYLKVGEANDRASKGDSEYVWSLRDVNFEIKQGDAVGIIGRNGAGKSTLLKILSRTTAPTIGNIKIKGRVASLLEVGTGFHPELSGRENIFLNGAILGMTKAEIKKKFDEIVDFAGVERYIDTPVKRYSSGMYVRLAFGVAAHLEPEILIVDEVLAVGDAEFQKKALGKMQDVSKGQGRTVLFVSHNMGVVTQLCNSAILLNKGSVAYTGTSDIVVQKYLNLNLSGETYEAPEEKEFYIKKVQVVDEQGKVCSTFGTSNKIYLQFTIAKNIKKASAQLSCTIQNKTGDYLTTFVEDLDKWFNDANGTNEHTFQVLYPGDLLVPNYYAFRLAIFSGRAVYDLVEMICPFSVIDEGSAMAMYEGAGYGYFSTNHQFKQIL
ncbi:ABC transporter ATP-binding protein [Pinibacter aurantiacus]|uniref:ATP-binding cassette domain-containing protein n=1 Tax=Pinibacter aurantiacus TaxID=2851599 RepID=A0A9E2SDF4_9BACT|nr:polysaccharide ABC transporter ATP-binding protein [Pinibacter aurantiacus]MBV4357835.1 ATP-binding cassette domain-containing protein [Pinibacter aurantiacus]